MNNILILGAGASIPFFENPCLTTKHLTDVISDSKRWKNIADRYTNAMARNKYNVQNINMVNADAVLTTLYAIKQLYKNYNFEQIIEMIDKISSFNFDAVPNRKIFHDILLFYGVTANNVLDHVWDCVPFLFRQMISEEITNLYENHKVNNYSELTKKQVKFIEEISNGQSFNIFSMNYDEVIFDAIQNLEIETGFVNKEFDISNFLSATKTISFPHGHSRFSYNNHVSDDNSNIGHFVLYHNSGKDANDYRLKNIGLTGNTETIYLIDSSYSYYFNTFISTGQQKEATFDINPYSAYYQKFASDCLKANRIYIVGYSFSDTHFNRMLLNILKIADSNKIIIVDYLPDNVSILNEFMYGDGLIKKIFNTLNIHSIPLNGDQTYKYAKEENDLNIYGYAEIYPQIILYKNGYDNFLNEFDKLTVL